MFEFHGMVRIKHACYATKIESGRVVKTKHAGATPRATQRAELRGARVAGAGQGWGEAVDALNDYAFHSMSLGACPASWDAPMSLTAWTIMLLVLAWKA